HELLARAARVIHQVPAFVSPAKQPLVPAVSGPAEPVIHASQQSAAAVGSPILPLPTAAADLPRRRPWKRWLGVSAAAALLLAAGIGWTLYERGLEDRRVSLAQIRNEIEALNTQFVQAQDEAKEKKDTLVARAQNEVVHLQVVGPAGYQPDAPSPLRIITRDVTGKPRPSQIVARLVSAEKKELFRAEASSAG